MKIGINYHAKKVTVDTVQSLTEIIRKAGHTAVLYPEAAEISKADRLLVLGGDGTILHAAQRAAQLDIPILGINFGTRGFLAEFEQSETAEAIRFLLSGTGMLIHRSMIEVGFRGQTAYCLNELSLLRNLTPESDSQTGKISLEIDGNEAGEFIADGLIVATPTGSTAYSLSAGGCIVSPDSEIFLLTPVCALSLRSRPIVCSDKSVLKLSVGDNHSTFVLHGDGSYLGNAVKGECITVKKSERCATFITQDKSEFFRRLTKKIN